MAKANFLKTWEVVDSPSNPSDVPANGVFHIGAIEGENDKVRIDFTGCWSAYTSQDGCYHDASDKVTATIASNRMTMTFPQSGGQPDYDKLKIEVCVTSRSLPLCTPEVGEWGAEACSGGWRGKDPGTEPP